MCYGISDISIGHSGTFFRVVCPKISTSQEKLAPTGLHGLHVFATLGVPYARRGTHYFKAFCPSSTKGILDVSKTPLSTCGHLWIQNKCFGPNAHYNVAGVPKRDMPEVPTID